MWRLWLLYGVVACEILVTYARLPAHQLYHVSGTGVDAGAGRALVFLNYPVALAALAFVALRWGQLGRAGRGLALLAGALCAVVFWPGVVSQADLDARAINALPALGVAVALVLTLAAPPARWGPARGDPLRIVLAGVLPLVALPWIAADLGFDFAGVPVLGSIFQTAELRAQPGVAGLHPAVHHGHHHGLDGTLLALTALVLSRARVRRLETLLAAYLSLMLAYGLANVANDFWLEQVVKRGWTGRQIPSVLQPHLDWAWAAIVGLAVVVWALWFRRPRARSVSRYRPARPFRRRSCAS